MRKDAIERGQALTGAALETRTQSGYHRSSFASLKLYTSDRTIPLTADYKRPGGKPLGEAIGLEIELASGAFSDRDTLTDVLLGYVFPQSGFGDDFVRIESDSSLRGGATAECVTQVMTPSGMRNRYPSFKLLWEKWFKGLGIMPNDSCGMHVNLSNAMFGNKTADRDAAVRKLGYIINHHYRLIAACVNRSLNHNAYCGPMASWSIMESAKIHRLDAYSDHGVCYNLGHYEEGSDDGRVEFRLVGPQTSYGCFRNTMEVVLHLVKTAKKLPWAKLDDVSAIFAGCNQYVYDRLKTNVYREGRIDRQTLEDIRPTVERVELV